MSAFFVGIAEWILEQVLSFLYSKAQGSIEQAIQQAAKDREQGVVNDANTKAYEEATDRAARIKAAVDLLNRLPPH